MPPYYFDIETDGLDPANNHIITAQFQKIGLASAKPEGPLTILKSWTDGIDQHNRRTDLDCRSIHRGLGDGAGS